MPSSKGLLFSCVEHVRLWWFLPLMASWWNMLGRFRRFHCRGVRYQFGASVLTTPQDILDGEKQLLKQRVCIAYVAPFFKKTHLFFQNKSKNWLECLPVGFIIGVPLTRFT
jgi:hypothetical protein